jgi:4,5-DOPA dioxygenase extradiol
MNDERRDKGLPASSEAHGGLGRREVLQLMAAGAATAAIPAVASASTLGHRPSKSTMPVIFTAHGNPMFMDDALFMRELHSWAVALPHPKAVLMVSAHWEEQPLTLGATRTVPLVYDFYGFPERYYQVKYPAPGAPELAARVRELLNASDIRIKEAPDRGMDHGAYVPMVCMYPHANVPVLQISLPSMNPQEVFEVGMALAPLRDEGVLIIGAGFMTHNLRTFVPGPSAPTPSWASEFDQWNAEKISHRDFEALLDYRSQAPGVRMALPTHEHYVPLLLAAGASSARSEAVSYPITGFMYGTFTKRSVQFG